MHLLVLFVLCAVGLFAKSSLADEEHEVKRGAFPFMAFVYYSDKTVVDRTGARLIRGAVLIRPEWLISSSLEDGDTSLAFPKETLIARLGAIRIDSMFSVNEDEEEQEREVVQMASPFNFTAAEWWAADITLLKTLLPFNITSVVAPIATNSNPIAADKTCFILIFSAPSGNQSDDKLLMKLSVDMLPSTSENCGSNFIKSSMMCAADSDDLKKYSHFCEGNSGSPLICDNEVVGIQTFISDCKPPHLFQRLRSWDNLITCAVEDKCHEEQCGTICNVINKDPREFPPQPPLAEAKVYPEVKTNLSEKENSSPASMIRRIFLDASETIPNKDNKEMNNTENIASPSFAEKETEVSSDSEMLPTVIGRAEDEQERSSSIISTFPTYADPDSTHFMYKAEELASKVEELKNLIQENGSMNKSQPEAEENKQKQRQSSSSSLKTRYPLCVILPSLILFYLEFRFIVNSF